MKNRMIKVVAYRMLSVTITLFLLYALTGSVKTATGVTILLHCFLTAGHFVFETLWEKFYESR
jgi:uncharacterized membrane protein